MPTYIPLHDRPPYFSSLPSSNLTASPSLPRYASPDLDPDEPYPWTRQGQKMSSEEEDDTHGEASELQGDGSFDNEEGYDLGEGNGYEAEQQAGPSRKRPRTEHEGWSSNTHQRSYQPGRAREIPIIPSIFGISPRNEFTKTVGEFIMAHCRGQENVEIEIKLGTLMSVVHPGEPPRRIRMPTKSEMIMPYDYPVGGFVSNMNKGQNVSLNRLLNQATESSQQSFSPIHFVRAQHTDSFHGSSTQDGKIRVSRDRAGRIVENGVITKKRLGNLNIFSPREAFDWRVSVSVENPCEMPTDPPTGIREKDRACYRHQLCQVDLTVVTTRPSDGGPAIISYELEIEILDAPALIAEGHKEERGEPNRFDEILQSCLDTVRMLVRNVG